MNPPRISIIMPNLNAERYLERAICSVLDQGYDNLELLVIDGSSVDASVQMIRRYENELAGWITEPDHGRADAINKGLNRATGQIIGIVNSDDLLLPHALHEVAARMTHADAPSWVVGQCHRIDESDQPLGMLWTAAPRSLASFLMHNSGQLPAAATFWHRSVIDRYGKFDVRLRFGFNYEYACRLLVDGREPMLMPQTLAARREHAENRSMVDTLQRGLDYIAAAQWHGEHLSIAQRCALWRNCEHRRRIYTMAQAETIADHSRLALWRKLMHHPWWLANESYRQRLLHGGTSAPASQTQRPAA